MKSPRAKTLVERVVEVIGSLPSVLVHTLIFAGFTILTVSGTFPRDLVLLVWNTIVSLEAIYLALFIQITVNSHTASLREVEEDIDEIQEDVEELGEDVEDIQEDIEEISEDIDEIQEDVEEMSDEDEHGHPHAPRPLKPPKVERPKKSESEVLEDLTKDMQRLLRDLEALKSGK